MILSSFFALDASRWLFYTFLRSVFSLHKPFVSNTVDFWNGNSPFMPKILGNNKTKKKAK